MVKPEGKRPLGRPKHRWEYNEYCIFRKWDVGACTGSSWLRIGVGDGDFECSNELSGSIKCGEFLN